MPCLRAASAALLCATIGTRSAAYEFTNASDDYLEDTIKFSPLDVETCRQVGEASATILSYTSPIGGQASLEVDWGDGGNQTYSTDAISGGAYAYDHAYRSPGLYEIRAVATVKQLSEDGTTWEKTVAEELVSTVQVRNDCYGTDTGNRGFEETGGGIVGSILSNWYGQMMEEAIEFAPIDGRKCFRGDVSAVDEDEMTTITLASIWSGDLTLTVDWGDGLDNQYESIVVRGYPKSFNHVWAAPGLYTIVATAEIKRPTLDGNDYEVVREELVANVEVDGDCATDDIDEDGLELAGGNEGTITGDWSFFDFGPTDDYLCRSAGEKSTALSLMSIFSGELTMDVQWGDGSSEQYSLNVIAGEPYSFDHIYDQAGTYEIRATARVSRLNTLGFSWSKISQQHQTWDVAEQELVTSIGVREGCEGITARSDVDIVGDMNIWFNNAVANALQIDPLVPDLCIHTNAQAPVVAVASLSSGFMNLAIDWGDEKTHRKGVNLKAGTSYSFDHAYEEAGTYNVVAKGYVRRLSSDRTKWEKFENEMTTTVRVRDNCPSIARGVDGGLSDWYDNMMSNSVQFSPMNSGACHKAGDYSSMLEVASVSSGYMALVVDWGVGDSVKYGFNADSGTPVAIPFAYSEPGTYHLAATAKIRRLSTNSRNWEVYEGNYTSKVIVAEDCSADALLNTGDSDNDKDRVNNDDENTAGTDPNHPDTDGDGASDGEEAIAESDPLDATDTPPIQDIDFDKVSNTLEGIMGTNPISPDTDGDGASDFEELQANTDGTDPTDTPSFQDSDGNGISDATEEAQGALQNALDNVKESYGLSDVTDEDGDGLNSDLELLIGSDPTNPHSDSDGVHDGEEVAHGSDPTDPTDVPDLPLKDTDGDSVSDQLEKIIGSDPTNPHSDSDGVHDGEEVAHGSDPTDPTDVPDLPLKDTDGDSVSDQLEKIIGSDPTNPHSDSDGVHDGEEVAHGSDPTDPTNVPDLPLKDTDGDSVSDQLEKIIGSDPTNPHSDSDGVHDGEEVAHGSDPTDPTDVPDLPLKDTDGDSVSDQLEKIIGSDPTNPHSDSDGVHDGEEVAHGSDPTDPTNVPDLPLKDTDGDSVSDQLEKIIGSDPTNPHSDSDGVHDGEEVAHGSDPTDPTDVPDLPLKDTDGDSVSDQLEKIIGSDPTNPHSDSDGVHDGEEVAHGSDPTDPTDTPELPLADQDQDGWSDKLELLLGFDPNDPNDPGKNGISSGDLFASSSYLCPNLLKEGSSHTADSFEKTEVLFYYCVESSADSSYDFLPQIEDVLLDKTVEDVVDCDLMMAKPGARMRSPETINNAHRHLRDSRAPNRRHLQAVGISSLPEDKLRSDISCTPTTNPSNTGYVVEGIMTVMHIEGDDAGATEDALRSSVRDAMSNGDLESIETVERVSYLGSTLEEVYKVPGVAAATTTKDPTTASDDPVAESKSILGTAVGVSLAAAFILLMLLLIRKKRRDSHTEDEKAGAANGLGMELDEMSHEDGWDGDDVENGGMTNQDESGSFHLGRYHYHSDGRRYYSKNCSVCAEMIAQYGEELYQESSFSRADSKDLSKTHSAVDVHNCTSATCLRCNNDLGAAPEVTFIKANGAICEPIAEETEDGADF